MALAWKAGWVNSPRGFESRILRRSQPPPIRLRSHLSFVPEPRRRIEPGGQARRVADQPVDGVSWRRGQRFEAVLGPAGPDQHLRERRVPEELVAQDLAGLVDLDRLAQGHAREAVHGALEQYGAQCLAGAEPG